MSDNHYYKAKLSKATSGDSQFEFLGTAIMFLGMFLVIATTGITGNFREASETFTPVIAGFYFLQWLCQSYPKMIYALLATAFMGAIACLYMVSMKAFKDNDLYWAYCVYCLSLLVIGGFSLKRSGILGGHEGPQD